MTALHTTTEYVAAYQMTINGRPYAPGDTIDAPAVAPDVLRRLVDRKRLKVRPVAEQPRRAAPAPNHKICETPPPATAGDVLTAQAAPSPAAPDKPRPPAAATADAAPFAPEGVEGWMRAWSDAGEPQTFVKWLAAQCAANGLPVTGATKVLMARLLKAEARVHALDG